ncbi:MAG: hypothetical protein AAF244_04090 [Pseudomonadota bacterium]
MSRNVKYIKATLYCLSGRFANADENKYINQPPEDFLPLQTQHCLEDFGRAALNTPNANIRWVLLKGDIKTGVSETAMHVETQSEDLIRQTNVKMKMKDSVPLEIIIRGTQQYELPATTASTYQFFDNLKEHRSPRIIQNFTPNAIGSAMVPETEELASIMSYALQECGVVSDLPKNSL